MTQTTPNLALPYPELIDTADVPRDIKALADKLDALLGGGGGGGGGGSGTLPLAAAPVLDVGVSGQVRAGRQLTVADFTGLGLSTPLGLFNLSGLTNLGSVATPLVNLGTVPFGVGINGAASTCAVFAGSAAQALYTDDAGAAYGIRTGSFGCWLRTAKRTTLQYALTKTNSAATDRSFNLQVDTTNVAAVGVALTAGATTSCLGVSDVADDRWHFIVGTHDGTALRVYVDGALEGVTAAAGLNNPSVGPLNIGGYGADASHASTSSHYGRVDEAFVTADVLTAEQVRLLYCARLAHTLGANPTAARLNVHRKRKGAPPAVADFPAQPIRLHNFTAGALTDQGSGGVALTNNGTAISVAGADGTPGGAFSFAGAQSLSATDALLPGGLTTRCYGAWFKTTTLVIEGVIGWGTLATADAQVYLTAAGLLVARSGADAITGPFVADGQWHHVVVIEDNAAADGAPGVKRKLYLDGRLVGGSTVLNTLTLAGANRFRVGALADGTSLFTGQIDAAFVYAGPPTLTAADVAVLYAKGAQDPGASPKNAGDHVERLSATDVLWIGDTLESQHTVDLGVVA